MATDITFIILGATGDLTKRKIIPAIYRLAQEKAFTNFAIIGVALPDVSIETVLKSAVPFIKKIDRRVWKKIENSSYYLPFDFYNKNDYSKLKATIKDVEKRHKLSGNHVFYFATMPDHFTTITQQLALHGIVTKQQLKPNEESWPRVVYEKPFGSDLQSARDINRSILKVFNENQVYRIDHYLGKELIGNIALVRFTNAVFEPLWNKKFIDSVQIVLSEKIGIEGRGEYYDKYGAMKDMLQSHMLQMLALVGMEVPRALGGKNIRDAKTRVLKKVKVESAIVGQYEGYREENGVAAHSKTDTFVAAKLYIDNARWKGVPFYLKTGKNLDKKEISIHIKFKMVKCLLSTCPSDSNYLTIRVQPNEGFFVELNTKVPGSYEVMPVSMDFCHKCLFGPNTPEAYENLLLDVTRGDQSVFLHKDEIELSWKIAGEIEKKRGPLHVYKKQSSGPAELKNLDPKRDIRWRA
jgi:glucose-6-phosphate 1-dehydrogenase